MKFSDFFDHIEAHPQLRGLGMGGDHFVVVADVGNGLCTRVEARAVEDNDWEELERILLGGRINALQHMSRVVGYFSFVHNWNDSKIGELKDRHKGNYAIVDAA